jgi:hypothetical protein
MEPSQFLGDSPYFVDSRRVPSEQTEGHAAVAGTFDARLFFEPVHRLRVRLILVSLLRRRPNSESCFRQGHRKATICRVPREEPPCSARASTGPSLRPARNAANRAGSAPQSKMPAAKKAYRSPRFEARATTQLRSIASDSRIGREKRSVRPNGN